MLMAFVLLFNTDFLELDNPAKVSTVQTKYANLLYRYIKTKYRNGAAAQKFCDAMFIGADSRELREIKERNWNNSE